MQWDEVITIKRLDFEKSFAAGEDLTGLKTKVQQLPDVVPAEHTLSFIIHIVLEKRET